MTMTRIAKILIANRGEIAVRIAQNLSRDGHRNGCRLLRRRRRSPTRRRLRRGRSSARSLPRRYLLAPGLDPGGRGTHRRRRGPPRLRVLGRERRVCRSVCRRRSQVHRPTRISDHLDGIEDRVETTHARSRCTDPRRRHRGRSRRGRPHCRSRQRRIPGTRQGIRRRRRQGHAHRGVRRRTHRSSSRSSARSGRCLRRRHRLPRTVSRDGPPRRDPGRWRYPRQRGRPLRTRMLDPAPPPEDHRRSAVARRRRRSAEAMGEAAVDAAKAVGYHGAGTVEFMLASGERSSSSR